MMHDLRILLFRIWDYVRLSTQMKVAIVYALDTKNKYTLLSLRTQEREKRIKKFENRSFLKFYQTVPQLATSRIVFQGVFLGQVPGGDNNLLKSSHGFTLDRKENDFSQMEEMTFIHRFSLSEQQIEDSFESLEDISDTESIGYELDRETLVLKPKPGAKGSFRVSDSWEESTKTE